MPAQRPAVKRPFFALAALLTALSLAACTSRSQPMGPPTGPAVSTADAFYAADGYRLPLHVWRPADDPRAVIIAVHGFDDYVRAFDDAGTQWAEDGIIVYGYDQRGFGATTDPGIWAGTDTLVADLIAVVRLVRLRHPDLPLVLVGESMGGAASMVAAVRETDLPVDGLVLVAPAVWSTDLAPLYQRWGRAIGVALLPGLVVSGDGLDLVPTDNIEALREMAADPLVLKENRLDTVDGLLTLMGEAYAIADQVSLPTLVLYGDNELIVPEAPIRSLVDQLRASGNPVTLAFYPDGYHMLLRDLNADIPIADIAAWTLDRTAPLPSGADGRPPFWESEDVPIGATSAR